MALTVGGRSSDVSGYISCTCPACSPGNASSAQCVFAKELPAPPLEEFKALQGKVRVASVCLPERMPDTWLECVGRAPLAVHSSGEGLFPGRNPGSGVLPGIGDHLPSHGNGAVSEVRPCCLSACFPSSWSSHWKQSGT